MFFCDFCWVTLFPLFACTVVFAVCCCDSMFSCFFGSRLNFSTVWGACKLDYRSMWWYIWLKLFWVSTILDWFYEPNLLRVTLYSSFSSKDFWIVRGDYYRAISPFKDKYDRCFGGSAFFSVLPVGDLSGHYWDWAKGDGFRRFLPVIGETICLCLGDDLSD